MTIHCTVQTCKPRRWPDTPVSGQIEGNWELQRWAPHHPAGRLPTSRATSTEIPYPVPWWDKGWAQEDGRSRGHRTCYWANGLGRKSILSLLRYWHRKKVPRIQFNFLFQSSLYLQRQMFWSVEVGQSSGGHSDCPSLIYLQLVSAPGRTVKWRTQWPSLTYLPAARIGPSDLRPLTLVQEI